jgi:hypothetical protein
MKLGPVVGSPKEIKNFIRGSGLNIKDLIEVPARQIPTIWVAVASAIVLAASAISVVVPSIGPSGRVLAFIGGSAAAIWLAVIVHIRYKTAWGASAIIIGSVALLLVSAGLIEPLDVLKHVRDIGG